MTNRNWLPTSWLGDKDNGNNPFGALRNQIDTLFEDFDMEFPSRVDGFSVRSNLSETDDAVRITAELPGVDMDDVEVSVTGNRITIKGEKKSEKEEKAKKRVGSFIESSEVRVRSIALWCCHSRSILIRYQLILRTAF